MNADAWLPRVLGAAYLVLGLVAVLMLARLTPPFQNPDELAHVLRAEQVEQGGLLGRRFADEGRPAAGGFLDGGSLSVYAVFEPLVFQPQVRATAEMFGRADTVRWGGKRWWQAFDNTAVYPPFLYLPAAAGLAAGRVGGMTVVRTLHLARLCGGLAAVAVGSAAVALAGGAAPLLFCLLSLPMALSLMAAVSQDAMLLAVAGLAAALLVRLRGAPAPAPAPAGAGAGAWATGAAFGAMCVCLALVGMARPVYLPAAVLPLLAGAVGRWARVAGAALVAGCVLAWAVAAAHWALVNGSEGGLADPAAQAAWLWAEPGRAWQVAVRTVEVHGAALAEGFVGRLGWLDLALPAWVRGVAWASLLVGALASAAPVAGRGWRGGAGRAVAVGVALASSGAVFAVQYLTWTPVGLGVVMGVQGRYFLPVALLLGTALPGRAVLPRGMALVLPAMSAVMLGGVVWAVVGRYYLR